MTNELKFFIADCVERAESEEREKKALAEAEEIEYEALYAQACAARLAEIANLPAALIPYCEATQRPGHHERQWDIKALKEGWRPDCWQVSAPGLVPIFFTVEKEWTNPTGEVGKAELAGKFIVKSLSTRGQFEDQYPRWYQAIAAAARLHREHEEYLRKEEAQTMEPAPVDPKPTPPTTAERLESLIRRIAREEAEDRIGEYMPT
jgi:hypothetical protein